jgi:hypothetical protein
MFPKMSNDTAAEELVAPTSWMCVATKSDNGLSAKVEIYHGNMKATTGERPHVKIMRRHFCERPEMLRGRLPISEA